MSKISKNAIIEEGAVIGENVEIGHFSVIKSGACIEEGCRIGDRCTIGSKVRLGRNNVIHSDVLMRGEIKIGNDNEFLPGCKLGYFAKCIANPHFEGKIVIGNHNFFGENTVVNLSEDNEGCLNATRIADRCYFMNNVIVHHDCQIGFSSVLPDCANYCYDTVICSGAVCNGYVVVGKGANIGANSSIHHELKVGCCARVGLNSAVVHNVLPFSTYAAQRTLVGHIKMFPAFYKNSGGFITSLLEYLVGGDDFAHKSEEIKKRLLQETDEERRQILVIMLSFWETLDVKAKIAKAK